MSQTKYIVKMIYQYNPNMQPAIMYVTSTQASPVLTSDYAANAHRFDGDIAAQTWVDSVADNNPDTLFEIKKVTEKTP